jgi:hypothetical protein
MRRGGRRQCHRRARFAMPSGGMVSRRGMGGRSVSQGFEPQKEVAATLDAARALIAEADAAGRGPSTAQAESIARDWWARGRVSFTRGPRSPRRGPRLQRLPARTGSGQGLPVAAALDDGPGATGLEDQPRQRMANKRSMP